MSRGTEYVLNRLKEFAKEKEKTFDLDQWESIFQELHQSHLSRDQAQQVIDSLASLAAPNENKEYTSATGPALRALSQAINGILEVRDYLVSLQPGDQKVQELISLLGLAEYLKSESLMTELQILQEEKSGGVGSNDLNPRLVLLFDLITNSNAFSIEQLATNEVKHLFQIFFEQRTKEIAARGKGEIVIQALSNISDNTVVQLYFDLAMEKLKRKNFQEFRLAFENLQRIMDEHLARQKQRMLSQGQETVQHQLQVLQVLSRIRATFAKAIIFFAEKELSEGINFISQFIPIHRQMVQVADNSVALIFIGLIKTGKSTVVDTIIGETVSPSRIEPMTAIPVRYIHDPKATEPVMLVPFFTKLNKVIRVLLTLIKEKDKETKGKGLDFYKEKLVTNHLRDLLERIHRGYVFRNVYKGAEDVLDASIALHDLFRLAVQEIFVKFLSDDLPLDWGQGLDGFLTVTIKFPHSEDIGDEVKLSVVDTPGVNEAGVKKLNLNKVITDSVEVSHYVAFTVDPKSSDAKDNTNLKKLIKEVRRNTKTPTLVLVTGRDGRSELPREVDATRENICNGLRDGPENYPINRVYSISAKRKLFADRMENFITKEGRKPELHDSVTAARKLAEDFAFFAVEGLGEDEKRGNYEKKSIQELLEICHKLIPNSYMKEPMSQMLTTASQNASVLSCNKAIEKTLNSLKPITDYLKRVHESNEKELANKQDLIDVCNQVSKSISDSVIPIRKEMARKVADFRRTLRTDIDGRLREQVSSAKAKIDDDSEPWEFDNQKEAEEKVAQTKDYAQEDFKNAIDEALEEKVEQLKATFDELKGKVRNQIFNQLQKVASKINLDESDFDPKMPDTITKMNVNSISFKSKVVSSEQKSVSLTTVLGHLLSGNFSQISLAGETSFKINREELKKEIEATLKASATQIGQQTGTQVEKSMNKALDDLFLQALRKVSQIGESLSNREKLAPESKLIEELYNELSQEQLDLKNFLHDIPAS